jgi:hypothetical protein
MKSLFSRKIFILNFNVVFIYRYKTSHMCVVLASHLKVHAANEKGLADEQSSFGNFFCSRRRLFCSWRHPFSPDGMRDSVANGSKFQHTGLLNLALPFCIKSC